MDPRVRDIVEPPPGAAFLTDRDDHAIGQAHGLTAELFLVACGTGADLQVSADADLRGIGRDLDAAHLVAVGQHHRGMRCGIKQDVAAEQVAALLGEQTVAEHVALPGCVASRRKVASVAVRWDMDARAVEADSDKTGAVALDRGDDGFNRPVVRACL